MLHRLQKYSDIGNNLLSMLTKFLRHVKPSVLFLQLSSSMLHPCVESQMITVIISLLINDSSRTVCESESRNPGPTRLTSQQLSPRGDRGSINDASVQQIENIASAVHSLQSVPFID